MEFPLSKLAQITDPKKLEVLQLIARVDRNIPRRTEDRAIRLLLDSLKASTQNAADAILKKVA